MTRLHDALTRAADLPVIQVQDGDHPEAVDATMDALTRAENLYIRADILVGAHTPPGEPPRISPYLREIAGRVARYERYSRHAGGYRPTDCPRAVADGVIARGHVPGIRRLTGIVQHPTCDATGRLIAAPGYDADTGLLLACDPRTLPGWPSAGVPDRPTRADAEAALAVLGDLVSTLPFAAADDRAAALAGIITALVRPAMPAAPMVAISATAPGTGKTLLAEIMGLLATGQRPPMTALSTDEIENEKRIASAFLAGAAMIVLDNISRPVRSDLLCQALTQPSLSVRPLGSSTVVNVPTNAVIVATGNQLGILGDLTRRTLLVRLDAGVERPELRRFDRDLIAHSIAHRGRLIAAALTITRAYIAAGRPAVDAAPLGSFGAWDALARAPLLWLGLPDPLAPAQSLRIADPDMEATGQLLRAWHAEFGGRAVTAAEVLTAGRLTAPTNGGLMRPELHEALTLVTAEKLTSRRLTSWLRAHQGRIVDSLKVQEVGRDAHSKSATWSVQECG